jgi:peptidoglycan/LPS O-acetylase OafA/YrhL
MIDFLNGVAMAGSLGVGLFFFRLWNETRDRFFALFGLAFWVLALTWIALILAAPASEDRHYFYVGRLVAFLLIIAAIVDKNRSSGRPRP